MLSTFIIGAIFAGIFYIAFRRVIYDMKQKGCSGCSGCPYKDKCSQKVKL